MRALVIGSSGQLGASVLQSLAAYDCIGVDHNQLEITNETQVHEVIDTIRPHVVVNTAAFHSVPQCEIDKEIAYSSNVLGPKYIASACSNNNAAFFHISTDYVFQGDKHSPYSEQDIPNPVNTYGSTKLAGERAAQAECEHTYVIRTCGLFGAYPCRAKKGGRNFVQSMLHLAATQPSLKVVNDQQCCPSYTNDVAEQIRYLAKEQPKPGIYHAVNEPGLTWHSFAQLIFSIAKINTQVLGVSSTEWDDSVKRPADSRLANAALRMEGINRMRSLDVSLRDYLTNQK